MSDGRYLLIKTIKRGFWHDMHHVLGRLLEAELTNRIPIVYWGKGSMYSVSDDENAFETFFMPVGNRGITDLTGKGYAFYPEIWNDGNLLSDDPEEINIDNSTGCEADVLVCNSFAGIGGILKGIDPENPLRSFSDSDLYSLMLKKYIKLRPEISGEIDAFYDARMAGKSIIGVHIRGSDKILEVGHLHEINSNYPAEIEKRLKMNPSARIFLMTDCNDILQKYMLLYGDILVSTDCRRVLTNGSGVHFQAYPEKINKGIEIIRDTWLASKCDCFIGNGHSNVSRAVSELKDWREEDIKLFC